MTAWLLWSTLRREVARVTHAVAHVTAELLQAFALLAGWGALTYGLTLYTSPKVWPLSVGLLLLSLCGWRWLASLFGAGLYTLITSGRDDG